MVTRGKAKKVYKSAETGKIVSKKTAEAKPKETYAVTVTEPKVVNNPVMFDKPYLMEYGGREFIGSLHQELGETQVLEHSVLNGCQSEEVLDVDADDVLANGKITPISVGEVYERLGY